MNTGSCKDEEIINCEIQDTGTEYAVTINLYG